jgi:hypothetical protein
LKCVQSLMRSARKCSSRTLFAGAYCNRIFSDFSVKLRNRTAKTSERLCYGLDLTWKNSELVVEFVPKYWLKSTEIKYIYRYKRK